MKVITFRMDDICPQMDVNKFLEYKNLFDQFNVKPLIGIIPDNNDPSLKFCEDWPDFWPVMRQLQSDGWAIAQHGYQHVYCSQAKGILTKRRLSEFAGLSYENQMNKIIKGRDILNQNGLFTDIFMAPGHSFDITTLQVLKECGFKYITDGFSSLPYYYEGIKFLPCRYLIPLILPGINTICIHANTSTTKTFNRVKKILQMQKHVCNFQYVLDIPEANLFLCKQEEKVYKATNKYLIIPLALLKKRILELRKLIEAVR